MRISIIINMVISKYLKKYLIGIGVFVLAILIITSVLLLLLQPKTSVEQGFWTTISGSVSHQDSDFTTNYVYVYHDYVLYDENTRLSQNAKEIAITNIENDNIFSITFWLPVDSQVTVTADDTGCIHKLIYISKENPILNLDLDTSSERCSNQFTLSNTLDQRYKNIQARTNSLSESRLGILDNFTEYIKTDLKEAFSELSDYSYEKNEYEQNETLLRAQFYLERAEAYSELARVKLCSQEGLGYIHNDSCTLYPYSEKNDLISANNTVDNIKFLLEHQKLRYGNASLILKDVAYINTIKQQIRDKVRVCYNSLNVVKKSYEDQEQTCRYRSNIFQFFNLSKISFFILIGMALGISIISIIKRKTDKISQKAKYTVAIVLFGISILLIILGIFLKMINIISISGIILFISSGALFPKDIYEIILKLLGKLKEKDDNSDDRPHVNNTYIKQLNASNSNLNTGSMHNSKMDNKNNKK